jgi:hypothetical protein
MFHILMIVLAAGLLAGCGGAPVDGGSSGGGAATATPIPATGSGVSFGTVTLSGPVSGTFQVASVTAVALDGNVSVQLGLGGSVIVTFDLPLEMMVPGQAAIGPVESAPVVATVLEASGTAYLGREGSITFTQDGEVFAAEFGFEAEQASMIGQVTAPLMVSGTVTDIRLAGEAG